MIILRYPYNNKFTLSIMMTEVIKETSRTKRIGKVLKMKLIGEKTKPSPFELLHHIGSSLNLSQPIQQGEMEGPWAGRGRNYEFYSYFLFKQLARVPCSLWLGLHRWAQQGDPICRMKSAGCSGVRVLGERELKANGVLPIDHSPRNLACDERCASVRFLAWYWKIIL